MGMLPAFRTDVGTHSRTQDATTAIYNNKLK
jgi:hypothetical protein